MAHIRYLKWFAVPFFLLFSMLSVAKELTIGIVPQFSITDIYNTWNPVLKAIEAETGLQFKMKPYQSIPDFEKGIMNSEVDIAYMNPYHLVMVQRAAGYIPIIRNGSSKLTGLLVVKNDSPYKSVADLEGKTIAFPAPNAFGASLYMRALLKEQEKINFKAKYVKTHTNVWRQVLIGIADAGGGVRTTLKRESANIQDNLRVLYETPGVNPHPLAVHPRVPESDRKAIQKAILNLAHDPVSKQLLANIQIPDPVVTNFSDYTSLMKLGLERYVVINGD